MDDAESARRFAAARHVVLGTRRLDGWVDLVPITFALDTDNATVMTLVDHKPKTTQRLQRLDNVRTNAEVTLLAEHYVDDDWSALWWVRARGLARVVEEGPERDRAAEVVGRRYDQYDGRHPAGPAIIVDVVEWTGWSASG